MGQRDVTGIGTGHGDVTEVALPAQNGTRGCDRAGTIRLGRDSGDGPGVALPSWNGTEGCDRSGTARLGWDKGICQGWHCQAGMGQGDVTGVALLGRNGTFILYFIFYLCILELLFTSICIFWVFLFYVFWTNFAGNMVSYSVVLYYFYFIFLNFGILFLIFFYLA